MDNSNKPTNNTKKIFIGVKIPLTQKLTNVFDSVVSDLSEFKIRWVNPENFHITVKYLGRTSYVYIDAIHKIITEAVKDLPPFELVLRSVSYFGGNRPRVLWIGVEDNLYLEQLHEKMDAKLADLGFQKDEKKFNPHLTIGRVKTLPEGVDFKDLFLNYEDVVIQKTSVQEIIIFESVSTKSGPVYKTINSIKIG